MRILKKIALGLLIVLVLLQFIPRTVNKDERTLPADITKNYPVPGDVQSILKKACYDCHSNNTRYPWYAQVQPFRWFLDGHIKQGKEELNFSEFGTYSKKKQYNKLRSIGESIKEGTMPLNSYRVMHADARLTETEKNALSKWVEDMRSLSKEKE